jgi:tRNA(adenine34) deaminase
MRAAGPPACARDRAATHAHGGAQIWQDARMRRERASAVCVHEGELLCVRLRDPATAIARLYVPGGGIDAGETKAAAAEREAREETGYTVCVDPASELVARYPFVWGGIEIDVTTHFFRAALVSDKNAPAPVHDDPWNEGALWLPLHRLELEFDYHLVISRSVRALARAILPTR